MRHHHGHSVGNLVDRQVFKWREDSQTHGNRTEVTRPGLATQKLGPYISISRDFGCGALPMAEELGEILGWPVYDRNLIDEIARVTQRQPSLVESYDERSRGWFADALDGFSGSATFSDHKFCVCLAKIVVTIARRGPAVMVGRGVNFILPSGDGVRVRLTAPLEQRIQWVAEKNHLSGPEAANLVREKDLERSNFVEKHFHRAVDDPDGYDVVFNVAAVPRPTVIESILSLAKSKLNVRESHRSWVINLEEGAHH